MPLAPITTPSPGQFDQVAVQRRVLRDHVAAADVSGVGRRREKASVAAKQGLKLSSG